MHVQASACHPHPDESNDVEGRVLGLADPWPQAGAFLIVFPFLDPDCQGAGTIMVEEYITHVDTCYLLDTQSTQCTDSDDGSIAELVERGTRGLSPRYPAHTFESSDDALDAPRREWKRSSVCAMAIEDGVNVRSDGAGGSPVTPDRECHGGTRRTQSCANSRSTLVGC
eukprot:3048211-Rhodomonas_salina.1